MNGFLWLIRRELWEHRAFIYVPLVVGALMVVVSVLFSGEIIAALEHAHGKITALAEEERAAIFSALIGQFAVAIALFMTFVVLLYLLDCLHAERVDRSILFWKSLPVSDAKTVLSKLAMAMVVAPLIVLASALFFGILEMIVLTIHFAAAGLGPWEYLWGPSRIFGTIAFLIYAVVVQALWHFPLFAWLLLVSAFAKRAVFLWAILPPVVVIWLERVIFDTHWFADQIGERVVGVFPLAFEFGSGGHQIVITDEETDIELTARLSELINPGPFLSSPALWIGLVIGVLLIAAAIWVRRYRDESI